MSKTTNLGLTLFDRGDKPSHEIFNENNKIIDTALLEASTHTHNGINSAKIKATDVQFSNYDTGLKADNIEDAIKEVFPVANSKIDWIVDSIGRTYDGFNNPDRRVDEIEEDFKRGRATYINNMKQATLFSTNVNIDESSSIEDIAKAINNTVFKEATATKEDIVAGSSFYTKYGVCQEGAMASNGETTVYPKGYEDTIIKKGGYTNLILKGFGVDDPGAYIKKGKTIFGVTGRFESDNPTGWNVGDSISKQKLTTTNENKCFIQKMQSNKAAFYSSYTTIPVFSREWKHFKVEVVSGKLQFTFYSEDFSGQVTGTVNNLSNVEEIYSNPVTNESVIMHRPSSYSYNSVTWGKRKLELFFLLCKKNGKDSLIVVYYDNLLSSFEYLGEINIESKYCIQGFVYDKDKYSDTLNKFLAYGYNKETGKDVDLYIQIQDNYNSQTELFAPTLVQTTVTERGVQDNYIMKTEDNYLSFNGGTLVQDGIKLNKGEYIDIKGFAKHFTNIYFEFFNNNVGTASDIKFTLFSKYLTDTYTYSTPTNGGASYWTLTISKEPVTLRVECTNGSVIVGGISDTDATSQNLLFSEEWGFAGEDVTRLFLGRNKVVYAYANTNSNYSYKCYTDLVYGLTKIHVPDVYIGRDYKLNDYNFNLYRMSAYNNYIYSTYYDTRNFTEGNHVGRVYMNTKKMIQIDIDSNNNLILKNTYRTTNEYKPFVPMYISSIGKVVGYEKSLTPQKYSYLCTMDMNTGTISNVMAEWSETIKRTHIEDLTISNDGTTRNALRMLTGVTECYRGQYLVPHMLVGNVIYNKTANDTKTNALYDMRTINSNYNIESGFLSLYHKMHQINSTRQ